MKRLLIAAAIIAASTTAAAAQESDAAFDTIVQQCEARVKAPRGTLQRSLALDSCARNHPLYSQIDAQSATYMAKRAALFARVKRGELDYESAFAETMTFRTQQFETARREQQLIAGQQAQIQAQQDIANEISNLPLNQALWGVTIRGIETSGRGYVPRMRSTHF